MSPSNSLKTPDKIALRVLVSPQELNSHGTAFGGFMLARLDQAGAIVAVERCRKKVMLVSVKQADFLRPVHVGDVLTFYGDVGKVGRTSITTLIEGWRCSVLTGQEELAVRAEVVYVSVDETFRPVPAMEDDKASKPSQQREAAF